MTTGQLTLTSINHFNTPNIATVYKCFKIQQQNYKTKKNFRKKIKDNLNLPVKKFQIMLKNTFVEKKNNSPYPLLLPTLLYAL